jgi:hypothetical protein
MEVLYPCCTGLDVHAETVVACVRIAASASIRREHRTVPTTTTGLLELAQWLTRHAIMHVAMEATGIYWKPVWHVLEEVVHARARQRDAHPQHSGAQERRQ